MVPTYVLHVLLCALSLALISLVHAGEVPEDRSLVVTELGRNVESFSEAPSLSRSHQRPWAQLMRRAPKLQQAQRHLPRTAPQLQEINATQGKKISPRLRQLALVESHSGYMLWQDVPGYNGTLCGEDGLHMWKKHQLDVQASRLNHCMDACEAQPWCAQLSFHGNPQGMVDTPGNYCILSSYPCIKTAGEDSALEQATDGNWSTMNFSNWVQVENMTGKHCSSADGFYRRSQEVETMEDCMVTCLEWSFCNYISYQHWEGNCDLVSACIPQNDTAHTEGFHVFRKS